MNLKLLQYTLIVILIHGCTNKTNKINLTGNWIIKKMYTGGNPIYPNDYTPKKFTFNITGYENYEKIEFQTKDSSIILPGFSSEELYLAFKAIGFDSIMIYFDAEKFDAYKTKYLEHKYQDTVLLKLSTDSDQLNSFIDHLDYVKKQLKKSRGSLSKQYDLAKSIYCGKYEISADNNRGLLLLSSDKTGILLVNEQFLIKKQSEECLEG